MPRIKSIITWAFMAILVASCAGPLSVFISPSPTQPKLTVTVFAASSLTEAFTELAGLYEADHPDVTVILNFAGSQQLAEQIAQGAQADVYASASQKYMRSLIDDGLVDLASELVFAKNRLIVIAPSGNPAGLTSYNDVIKPGVKLVLADEAVPVGKYSRAFLAAAGLEDAALANVVSYEESVKAVSVKVLLGEADAGIVYRSDVSAEAGKSLLSFPIPDAVDQIALYPIAPLSGSPNPELAKGFIDLVLSARGQLVLAKYNFTPIQ